VVQLPAVPNTSLVRLNWTVNGQRCNNVLHYYNSGQTGGQTAAVLGAAFVAKVTVAYRAVLGPQVTLDSITVVPLDAGNPTGADYVTGLPLAGTGATNAPNSLAAVISLKTPVRGRSFRGRIYQPGLAGNAYTNNSLTSAAITALNTFWQSVNILTPPGGGSDQVLSVVSYYANKALRASPVVTEVSSLACRTELATQRRRMP
jgi:hypothetical protein